MDNFVPIQPWLLHEKRGNWLPKYLERRAVSNTEIFLVVSEGSGDFLYRIRPLVWGSLDV